LDGEPAGTGLDDGQAAAGVADRCAQLEPGGVPGGLDLVAPVAGGLRDLPDAADVGDDACEHQAGSGSATKNGVTESTESTSAAVDPALRTAVCPADTPIAVAGPRKSGDGVITLPKIVADRFGRHTPELGGVGQL